MTYYLTPHNPPATLAIRIRRAAGGDWLPVKLLAIRGGWVVVDDGEGPLWVAIEHVHPVDWRKLDLFEQLQERQN